jgi:hypothetical protein
VLPDPGLPRFSSAQVSTTLKIVVLACETKKKAVRKFQSTDSTVAKMHALSNIA